VERCDWKTAIGGKPLPQQSKAANATPSTFATPAIFREDLDALKRVLVQVPMAKKRIGESECRSNGEQRCFQFVHTSIH